MASPTSPMRDSTNILDLPLELIQRIVLELDSVRDAICVTNTCKYLFHVLGQDNRLLWYNIGTARQAPYGAFNHEYDYLSNIKAMAGIGPGAAMERCCQLCFGDIGLINYNTYGFKVRACVNCLRENVIARDALRFIPGFDIRVLHTSSQIFYIDNFGDPIVYVWQPVVERKLRRLHPGISLAHILESTKSARKAHEDKWYYFFVLNGNQVFNAGKDIFDEVVRMFPPVPITTERYITDEARRESWHAAARYAKDIKDFGGEVRGPSEEDIRDLVQEVAGRVIWKFKWVFYPGKV